MAKSTNSSERKVVFGERRKGKAKKSRGPKEKHVKESRGQG
jgi:hypothetical protein